jgi:hypothetical protein
MCHLIHSSDSALLNLNRGFIEQFCCIFLMSCGHVLTTHEAIKMDVVSSVNCFHNIYHRGSRFTQLPTYLFSVVRLARGAVASFD